MLKDPFLQPQQSFRTLDFEACVTGGFQFIGCWVRVEGYVDLLAFGCYVEPVFRIALDNRLSFRGYD